MDTHTSRPRPLRQVTATATATGSALAVVLLPLVVGALVARSAGADPMASVNALIAGGGERAKLSRNHLPVLRNMRSVPRRVGARWAGRRLATDGPAVRPPVRPSGRRLLPGREDVRVEVSDGRQR
ncbi:hypothetical protein [Streptomyces sp. 11x1]|uniref:hypothetical protein n=1 Tax=Streptomyces sp. 11x1 TaxID=3038642 RepID=UPI00292E8176|nr:hypothetical protein [Streptomyces sp. 11x1]WNZ13759.1 hypothetical protein P8T65_43525 [Streptomyces sp. 11x1]